MRVSQHYFNLFVLFFNESIRWYNPPITLDLKPYGLNITRNLLESAASRKCDRNILSKTGKSPTIHVLLRLSSLPPPSLHALLALVGRVNWGGNTVILYFLSIHFSTAGNLIWSFDTSGYIPNNCWVVSQTSAWSNLVTSEFPLKGLDLIQNWPSKLICS